jgi:hypothetical protein
VAIAKYAQQNRPIETPTHKDCHANGIDNISKKAPISACKVSGTLARYQLSLRRLVNELVHEDYPAGHMSWDNTHRVSLPTSHISLKRQLSCP